MDARSAEPECALCVMAGFPCMALAVNLCEVW